LADDCGLFIVDDGFTPPPIRDEGAWIWFYLGDFILLTTFLLFYLLAIWASMSSGLILDFILGLKSLARSAMSLFRFPVF